MAELSHVFCCGLPMLAAIMSAGSQVGLSGSFVAFHHFTHAYEVPILIGSGLLLLTAFLLQVISYRVECNQAICQHGDCTPRKFRVSWIFVVALALFVVNVSVFYWSGHGVVAPRFN